MPSAERVGRSAKIVLSRDTAEISLSEQQRRFFYKLKSPATFIPLPFVTQPHISIQHYIARCFSMATAVAIGFGVAAAAFFVRSSQSSRIMTPTN